MRVIKVIIAIWVLAALIAGIFGKVVVAAEVGTTTASFLKIGPGAKALGMGGAFTAVADDPSTIYWNPAGLNRLEFSEVQFSHYNWYKDIKVENLMLALPAGRFSFGFGFTYLDYGDFTGYDINGNPTEDLAMYNLAGSVAAGLAITEEFSVGLTAKYVVQSFDVVKGSAFAGDAGILLNLERFSLAAAVSNFGTKMKFENREEALPTEFRGGLAFRAFNNRALFSLEGHAPVKGNNSFHQGFELGFANHVFARTGLSYNMNAVDGTNALNYKLGLGLNYGFGRFDYTFVPADNYGNEDIHNFSLSLRW